MIENKADRTYVVRNELDRPLRRNRNFLIKTNQEFQTQIDYEKLEVGDELDIKSNINKNLNNSNVNDNHVPDNDIINGDNTTPITSKNKWSKQGN